jgi:hypothetical protein
MNSIFYAVECVKKSSLDSVVVLECMPPSSGSGQQLYYTPPFERLKSADYLKYKSNYLIIVVE